MAASNGILHALERKATISNAQPERYTALRQAAENLSRRNLDGALVELFAEAMQRLTQLAYEQDEAPYGTGSYVNIDPVTWRLLLPAPFGRAGHRKWGISRSESDVLREMLRERQAQTGHRPPGLWLYERARRCWRLNLFDYDRVEDGQAYWQRWPLTIHDYRAARSRRVGR